MGHQRALDLERSDAVARAFDDVVHASDKPEIAVGVAPSHVAGVIEPVVPHLLGLFLVAVVALEEPQGLLVAHANADFALLSVLAFRAVGLQQPDVVLRVGLAHASRLRLHPWEGAQRHGRFGLAEALHHLDTRQLTELFIDGGLQSLAGGGAIGQRREVVFGEVLLNHEAIDGGRRAEGGDAIPFHLPHDFFGRELLMVEDEDRGSGEPLSVQFAPHGFAPSRVGHGQVNAVLVEVVPEYARGEVAQGIEEVVGHHLRFAAGAAGEVHQHGVFVAVDECRSTKLVRLLPFLAPIVESFGHGLRLLRQRIDGHQHFDGRTFGHGGLHLAGHIFVIDAQDGFHAGPLVSIYDVVLGEHVGRGDGHGPQFVQRQHGQPPLIVAFQDEHHLVAVADTQALVVGCGLVGLLFQLLERETEFLAMLVGPQECRFVGRFFSPCVDDVVGEVEVFGNDELEMLPVVFLRREAGLL